MSKTILLIDDDEVERTALREILKAEPDLRLIEAGNGQEGLDLLCDGLRPQLCLIDLVMPKIGGVELLRRIRRDPELRSLRAMVASANRDRSIILEVAKLRIDGYVLKPYDAAKTLGALRPVLATIPDPDENTTATRDLLGRTVLVIDDDEVTRSALATIIKRDRRWTVVDSADGQDALVKLRGGLKPDLCLVDLNMPQMDGHALLAALRADPLFSKLRVVVISAEQDRRAILALADLKIDAYLLKPLQPAKVLAVLQAAAP